MRLTTISVACLALSSTAAAQDLKVEPTLIQAEDGSATTFGLAYEFEQNLFHVDLGQKGVIDPSQPITKVEIGVDGSGLITESAEDNPENLLTATVRAEGLYQSGGKIGSPKFLVRGGGFASIETDQSFDNHHTVLGLSGRAGLILPMGSVKHEFGVDGSYGEVEPGEDLARKAALGATTLKNYDRFSFEMSYQLITGLPLVEDIEVNYRWFRERNAPAAIKAAELDKFDLFSVRIGLPGTFFVAYSDGKLPFDRENDRAFKAGFSYDLGDLAKRLQGGS